MIYSRYGRIPDEDATFLTAIREAGKVYERLQKDLKSRKTPGGQSSTTVKGNQDAAPTGKGNQSGQQTERSGDKGKGKGPLTKAGVPRENIWASVKEALEGVPQTEIEAHKEKKCNCWRCGSNNHRTLQCYSMKSFPEGTMLPIHPSKKRPSVNATKRKRTEEEVKEETEEPVSKQPKVNAVIDNDMAMTEARIWEHETDTEQDF
jgi:hypothetical protein